MWNLFFISMVFGYASKRKTEKIIVRRKEILSKNTDNTLTSSFPSAIANESRFTFAYERSFSVAASGIFVTSIFNLAFINISTICPIACKTVFACTSVIAYRVLAYCALMTRIDYCALINIQTNDAAILKVILFIAFRTVTTIFSIS